VTSPTTGGNTFSNHRQKPSRWPPLNYCVSRLFIHRY
jgi:hypothetical protein